MKKCVLALLFALWPGLAFGQGIAVKQSQASEIQLEAAVITGGFFTTTGGSQVTGIHFYLTKHADTGLPASSSWDPTVWGGGTHDCAVLHSTDQSWTCELTASDTDTVGRLEACLFITTQNVQSCKTFTVVCPNCYSVNVTTGPLGANDLLGGDHSAIVTSGGKISEVQTVDALGANAINFASIAAGTGLQLFPISVAYPTFTFPMFDSAGALKAGLTVSCTRYLNGGAGAACGGTVSAIGGGIYKITFNTADTASGEALFVFDGGATARIQPFHFKFQ